MVTQLNHTSQDLKKHKETLATTETLLHSQIEQLSDRLSEKDRQVAAIGVENDHLQEEVLSKTQQVKQYKKQVDQYKQEVGAHKQAAEMQMKQVHKSVFSCIQCICDMSNVLSDLLSEGSMTCMNEIELRHKYYTRCDSLRLELHHCR